ncbi:MAG: PEP-CTERM sorting domain-containing protein [Steroidobacteraceae bacterium]|nr:PEP-CTERM sorting domain-containing protein [Steroidobacteraceae bacterium]
MWGEHDELTNEEAYYQNWSTGTHASYARLQRVSYLLSWLSGLTFETRELAPALDNYKPINLLTFGDYTYETTTGNSGFVGRINLSSLTARLTQLPEPATLSLFGLALAGLGLVRRCRLTA